MELPEETVRQALEFQQRFRQSHRARSKRYYDAHRDELLVRMRERYQRNKHIVRERYVAKKQKQSVE